MGLTLVQNDFIAKDDHLKLATSDQQVENFPARLAPGFDIKCTDANDAKQRGPRWKIDQLG